MEPFGEPPMIIGLDFDGTLVTHEYPDIGDDLGAGPWLHQLASMGCRFVLHTMRDGAELVAAGAYCRDRLGIALLGVNTNPGQHAWTMSPKAYCHLYVDDAGLGAPTKLAGPKPAVDWERAGPMAIRAAEDWFRRHPFGAERSGDVQGRGRYLTGA